ncbi:MAG: hypothetical protein UX88_C0023G0027 [Candidatus Woesebacteria bacterium GW2011_GWC2_47_16]|uniref:Uncharacterized protein n=3 Tax=Candidatus Woeseibacteriota TaxID=1752722 RepID=A0A0G1V1A7_9BACT|nr:MAG: hypothetical protein UX03_C0013G0020 [Candidatus Woesebacteria bacterium GW2011_GWE1_45_18]KKU63750.1 MAG: hypothetical protein UX88_C0023G0027 [Candidatus Woesebacteria bacterium GW2011_GWC2_47_16]OGM90175.1 MAG: hypothetical protein A2597_02675 [Candidatus Woesebacteria bacterium RIFOXYD1_FULL_46_19]
MKILKGAGGMKLGFPESKEGEPRVISLWEPTNSRRQLANVFVDGLMQLTPEQQTSITKEQLEQQFAQFKKEHPLQEDEYRGYLTLYLVFVEADSRAIEQRGKIIAAGRDVPAEDVPAGQVADIFYRLYDENKDFWPE